MSKSQNMLSFQGFTPGVLEMLQCVKVKSEQKRWCLDSPELVMNSKGPLNSP